MKNFLVTCTGPIYRPENNGDVDFALGESPVLTNAQILAAKSQFGHAVKTPAVQWQCRDGAKIKTW